MCAAATIYLTTITKPDMCTPNPARMDLQCVVRMAVCVDAYACWIISSTSLKITARNKFVCLLVSSNANFNMTVLPYGQVRSAMRRNTSYTY